MSSLVAGLTAAVALALPLDGQAQDAQDVCGPPEPGISCGPGNNRRTAGGSGTGNVPHNDGAGHRWPAISGILWIVQAAPGDQTKLGGSDNDELLGHHGSDHLSGAGGNDILWGDWDPHGNSSQQHDYISGGSGDDWLYPSHGRSRVLGGPGRDYVWGYYGKGTIDCGSGQDTVRVRTNGAFRLRNCEKVRHFCAHGENAKGQCLSPTGNPVPSSRRIR
jgi:Ca2+-binding RTX toxin-like protein